MKKLNLLFVLMLSSFLSFAQAPQLMNYQGIARDKAGHAMEAKQMQLRISIIDGEDNGKVVYAETHDATTNNFGLYNLKIGNGRPQQGLFEKISWAGGNKYIKVEVLEENAYVDLGTTQLLSVPYALYAEKSGSTANTNSSTASRGGLNFLSKFTVGGLPTTEINSGIFEFPDVGGIRQGVGITDPTSAATSYLQFPVQGNLHVRGNRLGNGILLEERSAIGFNRFAFWNDRGFAGRANMTRYGSNFASGTSPVPGALGLARLPYKDMFSFGGQTGPLLISNFGSIGMAVVHGGVLKPRVFIDSFTSNVGIGGNVIPAKHIHLSHSELGSDTIIITNNTTGHSATDGVVFGNTSNEAFYFNQENNALVMGTNNQRMLNMSNTGRVGIGNPAPLVPQAELHVQSTNASTPQAAVLANGKTIGVMGEAIGPYAATGMTVLSTTPVTSWPFNAPFSEAIGVFGKGSAPFTSFNGITYGVAGTATNTSAVNNVGVYGEAGFSGGYNVAVSGLILNTTGGAENVAVAGQAPINPNSYAGKFTGKVKIIDGSEGIDKVLVSDAFGTATWTHLCSLSLPCLGGTSASTAWNLLGNTGTTPSTNYIGTSDAQDLVVKTNATEHVRVTQTGEVGIGTSTPIAKLEVNTAVNQAGVFLSSEATTILADGVLKGEYNGTLVADHVGVMGRVIPDLNTNAGIGVLGDGGQIGTYGLADKASDLIGTSYGAVGVSANDGTGVGVIGIASDLTASGTGDKIGVSAYASSINTNYGVQSTATGGVMNFGMFSYGEQTGVLGEANNPTIAQTDYAINNTAVEAIGILGKSYAPATPSGSFEFSTGVAGSSVSASTDPNHANIGMWAEADKSVNNFGIIGWAEGSDTSSFQNVGVYGYAPINSTISTATPPTFSAGTNYAGYFEGDVFVDNTIQSFFSTSSLKAFTIDHPLDPKNKVLSHSSVESPDMMNIYNGNIVTNASSVAIVTLPDYFEALNQDFRYQLTVMDQTQFAQARISKKITANQFEITTDKPNIEISWQVTGVRHDAAAEKNRIVVERLKTGNSAGKYIWPQAFEDGAAQIAADKKLPAKHVNTTTNNTQLPTLADIKVQQAKNIANLKSLSPKTK